MTTPSQPIEPYVDYEIRYARELLFRFRSAASLLPNSSDAPLRMDASGFIEIHDAHVVGCLGYRVLQAWQKYPRWVRYAEVETYSILVRLFGGHGTAQSEGVQHQLRVLGHDMWRVLNSQTAQSFKTG